MSETFYWQVEASREQAEESILQVSPNARIDSDADLRHRVRLDGDDRFSLLHFEVAGYFEGTNEPDDTVTVAYARSGALEWETGDQRGTGELPWMQSLTGPTLGRLDAVDQFTLFLKQKPLTEFGRALYGDDRFRLDFDGPLPVDQQHGRIFGELLVMAQHTAETDLFHTPILRSSLYRSLAVTLLESYRLTGDRRRRTITAEGRLRRYRIAQQFIDDHASLPITVEDVARTVSASTLEVQEIFRGHSPAGCGLSASLRRARLAAAHDDLVRGDPTLGDTVREIAHRWGYADPSTFAKHYRQQYGVSPKYVLDR
ncbi:helix-turn-helix transcriptional regulator [uncultured Amnibacterium sp.]|uniref:helix-turn-helix transcriptional regulator n=1 Tax=uncultured Amnibacterium sp. TaxID=1631851 RepID=UPI0035C94FB3